MAQLPTCQMCNTEMILDKETDLHWSFRCPRDGCIRVFSRPLLKQATRLERDIRRNQASRLQQQRLDGLKKFSFPSTPILQNSKDSSDV